MGKTDAPEILPGTLDLLILRTLAAGQMHGYGNGLAHNQRTSDCRVYILRYNISWCRI
jgi:hypothetical protein